MRPAPHRPHWRQRSSMPQDPTSTANWKTFKMSPVGAHKTVQIDHVQAHAATKRRGQARMLKYVINIHLCARARPSCKQHLAGRRRTPTSGATLQISGRFPSLRRGSSHLVAFRVVWKSKKTDLQIGTDITTRFKAKCQSIACHHICRLQLHALEQRLRLLPLPKMHA